MLSFPTRFPRDLPLSSGLVLRLDNASRAVATLAGVGETVPNPHMLAQPFIRREAVLSSRIEGTIASLSDILAYEASGRRNQSSEDVEEVRNYVVALEYGIERLNSLPISYRLVNELHERLYGRSPGREQDARAFSDDTGMDWSARLAYPGRSVRAAATGATA